MPKIVFTSVNHFMTPMILFILLILIIFTLILLRLQFKINYFEPITGNPNLIALKCFLPKKHPKYLLKYGNCSVLSFKITSLNRVNQTYGYEIGDELIIHYSTRIKRLLELLGINHYFSTIRDNTFIILVYGLNEDELLVYTEKIIAELDMPFLVSKYEILTHTAAGIAIITKTTEIYKHGKVILTPIFLALEKASKNYEKTNKSSYYVYNETLKNSHDLLRERFIELDTALKNNEFEPFYQPLMNINHEIISFESLSRWNHPKKGYLTPYHYLNEIINFGLITTLDYQILKKSLRQLKLIHEKTNIYVPVSVNFTIETIMQPMFVNHVLDIINEVSIDPSYLTIEITEHSLITEISSINQKIANLAAHGIKIALDDFGSGYSNLSVLSQLNFDYLKLDRSLVTSICNNDKISNSIYLMLLEIVNDSNKKLVCEGIETSDMIDVLVNSLTYNINATPIDEKLLTLQGYFFSKPIPLHELILYSNALPIKIPV